MVLFFYSEVSYNVQVVECFFIHIVFTTPIHSTCQSHLSQRNYSKTWGGPQWIKKINFD